MLSEALLLSEAMLLLMDSLSFCEAAVLSDLLINSDSLTAVETEAESTAET